MAGRRLISVVIVDDHPVVIAGLRRLLRAPEFVVAASATCPHAAMAEAERLRPVVAVTDVAMPEVGGAEVASFLNTFGVRVVAYTALPLASVAGAMLGAGCWACVSKNARPAALRRVLLATARARARTDPRLLRTASADVVVHESRYGTPSLSRREITVARLVATGLSSAAIAETMGVSVASVRTYRKRIATKLGLRTTAQVTCWAVQSGLVNETLASGERQPRV